MTIIKNIIVAFSLYSKIPMPIFEWKEKDMKHNLVFLPWIGLVIGGLSYLLNFLMGKVNAPFLLTVCILTLIPLLVTGGFHIDGFMDVRDALSSYAEKERKLEILKDPHIGAFAVIHLAALGLFWLGSMSALSVCKDETFIMTYAMVFFIARAMGGVLSLKLKKAKKDGMLNMETKAAGGIDFWLLLLQALIGLAVIAFINIYVCIIVAVDILLFTLYYRRSAYRNFGGITGDLTGFYITTLETFILFTVAVACLWL